MATPTSAFKELSQYASASGTASAINAGKTYIENLSASVTKAISDHKLMIGIGLAIAVATGIGTYAYLKKHKKGKK